MGHAEGIGKVVSDASFADKPRGLGSFYSLIPICTTWQTSAGASGGRDVKYFSAPAALLLAICTYTTLALGEIPPSETLLPSTTKGYVSVPNVEAMIAAFNKTQLGELIHDPIMEPFVEDLRGQLQAKFKQSGLRLGLQLEDLKGIYSGEVALAAIQPEGNKKASAMILIVDITGKQKEAAGLVTAVSANLEARGAKKSLIKVGGVDATLLALPKKATETIQRNAIYVISGDMLLIGDHEPTMETILKRTKGGDAAESLVKTDAYQAIMARCTKAAGAVTSHAKWFVEPFGYVDVIRASNGGKRRRGKDLAAILARQGFAAVKGIGGVVSMANAEADLIHNTFVYAPTPSTGDRLLLAARMLDFPNSGGLSPADWVPESVGSYLTLNWKVQDAFSYSKSLVDEMFDEVFDTTLDGLKNDPDGPQVDIRNNLVNHLGERITLLTDNSLPIDLKSERLLFAIEVTSPEKVKDTIDKMMQVDPNARLVTLDTGEKIWEIVNEDPTVASAVPELNFDDGGDLGVEDDSAGDDDEGPKLPNSAIGVINGHLIVSSHVEFISEVAKNFQEKKSLGTSRDYQAVNEFLSRMSAGEHSLRAFSRTATTYQGTYELIRQGKMPQGETLLASALNKLFGEDEDGVERKQQIDGSKLPEFSKVAKYFGNSGFTMTTEADGWLVSGCLLRNEK